MPVTAKFIKDKDHYAGSITGREAGSEILLSEVVLEGTTVRLKFDFRGDEGPVPVALDLTLAGDVLEGQAHVTLASQAITFDYRLKRVTDNAVPADIVSRPAIPADEQRDFERIGAETNATAKKQLIDAFAQQHPQSILLAAVYQQGAYLARGTNDIAMMDEYGGKSLAAYADNFVLMTDLSDAYVRRNMPDRAEPMATRALELIEAAPKPAEMSEEQFLKGKKILSATNFATLGFVHLRRAQGMTDPSKRQGEAEKSVAPFKKALEIQPADDYTLYGLGFVYGLLNDYPNAESTLAKAVAANGPISPNARPVLEDIYRARHKSLDGLDQIIAQARSELGVQQQSR